MHHIVRLNEYQRLTLAEALTRGKSVRICTGEDSTGKWIKWDSGSGWTPPYYGLDW